MLGSVRDYLGEMMGGFWRKNEGEIEDTYIQKSKTNKTIQNILSNNIK